MKIRQYLFAVSASMWIPTIAATEFTPGPVIKEYGKTAPVIQDQPLQPNQQFKVAFDAVDKSGKGELNRKFNSLARFLNMHARAGVDPDNIQLALVVHGKAGFDLLNDSAHREKYGQANPNAKLLAALQEQGVRVMICGQSAAHLGIGKAQLLPGVEMALSAMTAHALLQQQGYTLNPF